MKESGIGRENGLEAFEACKSDAGVSNFTRVDTFMIKIHKASLPSSTLPQWRKLVMRKIGSRKVLRREDMVKWLSKHLDRVGGV